MLPVEGPAESTRTTGPLGKIKIIIIKTSLKAKEVGNLIAINSLVLNHLA